jgi:hypothetical protein
VTVTACSRPAAKSSRGLAERVHELAGNLVRDGHARDEPAAIVAAIEIIAAARSLDETTNPH